MQWKKFCVNPKDINLIYKEMLDHIIIIIIIIQIIFGTSVCVYTYPNYKS